MSATGRRKHTQLLLRSMHEGFQQGEEAPNVRSPPRSALPPSCSGPGVGARSAWHLTAGALLFAKTLPDAPTAPAPSAAGASTKKEEPATKEWLPAYLSSDRHEAGELVAMVQSRRKEDGTFFTGS